MTTYDRLDWHLDSAIAAGQPPENAFSHIGLYLAWVIRRDLHSPKVFPASHIAAVKTGEMTGSDLSDDIDTKLTHHDLNAEGRAFSDARYATYLAEYETVFADQPDYSVTDDPANYALIAPLIDRMYAAWVAEGRPEQPPADTGTPTIPDYSVGLTLMSPSDMSPEQIQAVMNEMAAELGGEIMLPPTPEQLPHVAPDLEALLPRDITSPPLDVSSVSASQWGSSLVNRALKRLDVRPRDAVVVTGMGGPLIVMLYGIPGVATDRLMDEFGSAIYLPTRGTWSAREFAGRMVNWATGPEFTVAFWAQDGLVVHVAGPAEDVERAIPLLP